MDPIEASPLQGDMSMSGTFYSCKVHQILLSINSFLNVPLPSRMSIGNFLNSYSYGGCFHAKSFGYSLKIYYNSFTAISKLRIELRSVT